jgi:hypothetical protein
MFKWLIIDNRHPERHWIALRRFDCTTFHLADVNRIIPNRQQQTKDFLREGVTSFSVIDLAKKITWGGQVQRSLLHLSPNEYY